MQETNLVQVNSNPFRYAPEALEWNSGDSITDILDRHIKFDSYEHTTICINGVIVKREYWHVVYPKPGTIITIKTLPQDSGILRPLAFIALAVVVTVLTGPGGALFLTGNPLGTAIIAGGLFAAGALAINALIPPPSTDFEDGDPSSASLSIAGARNRLNPFGVMPMILGTIRTFPPYAAYPYGELTGTLQDVRMLFCLGYKDIFVDTDSIQIGNTDLHNFDEVELELDIKEGDDPITIYSQTVIEDVVNKGIGASDWVVHSTSPEVTRTIYEIHFPQGLVRLRSDGSKDPITVSITVQYRNITDNDVWRQLKVHKITAATTSPIRNGYDWRPPLNNKQWEIRMKADTGNGNTDTHIVKRFFAVLRNFFDENPVRHPNAAQMAIKLRATDQLSGVPDTISVVCTTICPIWNAGTWDYPSRSNNPAALARLVLTGVANAHPLEDIRIDEAAFGAWFDYCVTRKFTFNMVVDSNRTVFQILQLIGAAGRARIMQLGVDGIWTVSIDDTQLVSHHVFSPRNSYGMTTSKNYPNKVHAWRIRYINEAEDYVNDETVWYNYKSGSTGIRYNSNTAINYESLELQGITNFDQVNHVARYYAAVLALQPETMEFSVDAEQLVVLPGDRVEYAHDALLISLGAFRITNITTLFITLDGEVALGSTDLYGVLIQHADGTSEIVQVETPGTPQALKVLTISTPGLYGEIGDLAVVGVMGKITQPLIVRDITPSSDLSASLRCVPYSDNLYEEGPIEDYDSKITQPIGSKLPVFEQIRSDESVLVRDNAGILQNRMLVEFGFLNARIDVTEIVVRYRDWPVIPGATTPWQGIANVPGDTHFFYINGVFADGQKVEVRARYLFNDGSAGAWAYYYDAEKDTPYHTIVGQTSPPPDLSFFSVTADPDGTRVYNWDYSEADLAYFPPDVAGVQIRYLDTGEFDPAADVDWYLLDGDDLRGVDGPGPPNNLMMVEAAGIPTWEEMGPLHLGVIPYYPWEANAPNEGDWYFAIKAQDFGGRQSLNALYTTPLITTLPLPRLGNSIAYLDHFALSWLPTAYNDPGAVLTDCNVSEITGFLLPNGTGIWGGGVATETWSSRGGLWSAAGNWDDSIDASTWAGLGTWAGGLEPTILCTHENGGTTGVIHFDAAVTVKFNSTTYASAGTPAVEITYKNEDVGGPGAPWVAFATLNETTGYLGTDFSFKLTYNGAPAEGILNWTIEGTPG